MTNRKTLLGAAGLASLALAFAQPSSAATAVYNLTVDGSSGSLPGGPYGTITVTENAGGLDIVQILAAGFRIHDTTNGNHNAFAFSIVGDPNVTISNLTSGFSANNITAGTNVSAPSLGSFFTAISCDAACGPGYNGGFTGNLSFRVTTTGSLSLASLLANSNSIVFATDVVSSANGNPTGNVGARAPSAVPESATWAMMIGGFGLIGGVLRRRPRVSVAFG